MFCTGKLKYVPTFCKCKNDSRNFQSVWKNLLHNCFYSQTESTGWRTDKEEESDLADTQEYTVSRIKPQCAFWHVRC